MYRNFFSFFGKKIFWRPWHLSTAHSAMLMLNWGIWWRWSELRAGLIYFNLVFFLLRFSFSLFSYAGIIFVTCCRKNKFDKNLLLLLFIREREREILVRLFGWRVATAQAPRPILHLERHIQIWLPHSRIFLSFWKKLFFGSN